MPDISRPRNLGHITALYRSGRLGGHLASSKRLPVPQRCRLRREHSPAPSPSPSPRQVATCVVLSNSNPELSMRMAGIYLFLWATVGLSVFQINRPINHIYFYIPFSIFSNFHKNVVFKSTLPSHNFFFY